MVEQERRQIRPEDFKPDAQFGPKGLIPPVVERNLGLNIATSRIIKHFKEMRGLVESGAFKSRFSEEDCEMLAKHYFGDAKTINIAQALKELRPQANNPETKLLIRTLSIYSFDQLSPEQTKRINLKQHYEDLHILEREILPAPRRGGGSKFIIYRLSLDEIGHTRLHLYPPPEKGDVTEDSRVHEHFGDSSSIILAGELLNLHHRVTVSDKPESGNLALYEITAKNTPEGGIERRFQRKYYLSGTEVVSKNVYKAGDYYHLPSPMKPEYQDGLSMTVTPEMQLTYHTVANMGPTATLFVQRAMPFNRKDLVVMPSDKGEEFTAPSTNYKVDSDECYELLKKADKKIRKELEGIDKVPGSKTKCNTYGKCVLLWKNSMFTSVVPRGMRYSAS